MEMVFILGPSWEEAATEPSAGPVDTLTAARAELRTHTLASVPTVHTRRAYGKTIDNMFRFSAGRPLTRALLLEFRGSMSLMSGIECSVTVTIDPASTICCQRMSNRRFSPNCGLLLDSQRRTRIRS